MNENKSLLTQLSEILDEYRAERRRTQTQDTPSQPGRLRRFLRWLTPNGGTLLLIAALLLTAQVWAKPLASPANAPGPSATTVNYQGRLADSGGAPLDGSYGMTFALYDAASDGDLVWGPESHAAVPVSEGLFSVGLGSQTSGGIPTSVWNGDRYLEITVGGETLSPRELIRSVPVAGMALTVPDGAVNNQHLALTRHELSMSEPDHFELTDSEQVLGEMTIDVPYPATYLTFLLYAANGHGGRSILFMRDENGDSVCNVDHTSDDVLYASRTCMFELPAGTHIFRLSARTASSFVGQEVRYVTRAIIVPIAQAP